jgi:ATP-dependent helicase Lhr and Lhr-like helicase
MERLAEILEEAPPHSAPGGAVIAREPDGDLLWWTWGGFRTNATLRATIAGAAVPVQRTEDAFIRLREDLTHERWKAATADAADRLCLPEVDEKALNGLKFSAALPKRLAEATLAARLADLDGAVAVLRLPTRWSA